MCVIFRQCVTYHSIIFLSTQNDSDRRIVTLVHHFPRVVIYIHLHLANVLMRQSVCFQINKDKALQNVVVEYKVNEKVLSIQSKAFLT